MIQQAIPACNRVLSHVRTAQSRCKQVSHGDVTMHLHNTQLQSPVPWGPLYPKPPVTPTRNPPGSPVIISTSPIASPDHVELSVHVSVRTLDLALVAEEQLLARMTVKDIIADVTSTAPEVSINPFANSNLLLSHTYTVVPSLFLSLLYCSSFSNLSINLFCTEF